MGLSSTHLRVSKALATSVFGSATLFAATSAHANLTIIPTFDSSITGSSNAAQIEATLNQVCAFYNANFADNDTVHITFANVSSGLGSNNPSTITVPYTTFRAALAADATTANDAIALAHLANQTNNPVDNTANIVLTRANARAIGISAPIGVDDTINLNTSICFLNHSSPVSGQYDLYAVACHEMDEALGTPSGLSFGGTPWSADMFRYDQNGARTYTTNTSGHAYLSLDGTTDIVEYNQFGRNNGGDWGDWIDQSPPQVQDWVGAPGVSINMGNSELTLLDAVGYDRITPAPEPASIAALSLGALALLRRRRKG